MRQSAVSPRVAHIVSVSGAKAVAILERSGANGGAHVRVEIGATMTIPTPQATVVGLVSAVSVPLPDATAGNGRHQPDRTQSRRRDRGGPGQLAARLSPRSLEPAQHRRRRASGRPPGLGAGLQPAGLRHHRCRHAVPELRRSGAASGRRPVRQAFPDRRHDGMRKILGAHLHPAQPVAGIQTGARRHPRHPQRIFGRVRRTGRDDRSVEPQPALLAA